MEQASCHRAYHKCAACGTGLHFFEVLDSVTIARSRRHIEKYYNISDVGTFPERLKPISVQPCLTSLMQPTISRSIMNWIR